MTEQPDNTVNVQAQDSGRLLTPEEVSFLQQFLLESETVVVVGRDDAKKPPYQDKNSK